MKGFTLVELILVIALISILSVITSGMFFRSDQFTALTAREQLAALALLAQKRALANGASGDDVELSISQEAEYWLYQVTQGSVTLSEERVSRAGASLRMNSSLLNTGSTLVISFDQQAETSGNYDFLFSASNDYELCIASTGFAYIETCRP